MGTGELIGWAALAMGFAGAFGIFATHRALRRLGSLAMGAGLLVFALVATHIVLGQALAGHPALPVLWILSVAAAAVATGWLTRYFYRDLDLHYGDERQLADSE